MRLAYSLCGRDLITLGVSAGVIGDLLIRAKPASPFAGILLIDKTTQVSSCNQHARIPVSSRVCSSWQQEGFPLGYFTY